MDNDAKNIYLIGLPGAGKTTVGRLVAKLLNRDFCDSDQFLIARTGVSVKTIFDLEGEIGFRSREKKAIEELTARSNAVIATGGGAILDSDNRDKLKTTGIAIYLQAKPEFIYARMIKDNSRPLLEGNNLLEKLSQLYLERKHLYEEVANIIYPINEKSYSVYKCAEQIQDLIQNDKYFSR